MTSHSASDIRGNPLTKHLVDSQKQTMTLVIKIIEAQFLASCNFAAGLPHPLKSPRAEQPSRGDEQPSRGDEQPSRRAFVAGLRGGMVPKRRRVS
jgi:hypothetical protein